MKYLDRCLFKFQFLSLKTQFSDILNDLEHSVGRSIWCYISCEVFKPVWDNKQLSLRRHWNQSYDPKLEGRVLGVDNLRRPKWTIFWPKLSDCCGSASSQLLATCSTRATGQWLPYSPKGLRGHKRARKASRCPRVWKMLPLAPGLFLIALPRFEPEDTGKTTLVEFLACQWMPQSVMLTLCHASKDRSCGSLVGSGGQNATSEIMEKSDLLRKGRWVISVT